MSDPVQIERHAAVAVVRLAVPEKRNALGTALYTALVETMEGLRDDASVRAAVITGGQNFCAGGDLEGLEASGLALRSAMQHGHRIVRAIVSAPFPVVAAVEGNAFGAGMSLAVACDFILADESARFCAAYGRVGLAPDYGLLWTLPQRIGTAKTRELVMLCEPVSGADAHRLGIVDRLCSRGSVLESALELAQRLAATAPGATAMTKAMLARQPLSLDALLAWEADAQALLLASADFREGARAFLEKRQPRFEGR